MKQITLDFVTNILQKPNLLQFYKFFNVTCKLKNTYLTSAV